MIRLIAIGLVSFALVACSRAPGNPCSLLKDASASIGLPVTAELNSPPGRTTACAWKAADGRVCGGVTVLGPGWNEFADVSLGYQQLTESLTKLGTPVEVADVADAAQSVDTGEGVMIAYRKNDKAAVTVTNCNGHSLPNGEFAKKLAREIAERL